MRPCPISDHVRVAATQVELVSGSPYFDSHNAADGGSGPEVRRHLVIVWDCMSSLQLGI